MEKLDSKVSVKKKNTLKKISSMLTKTKKMMHPAFSFLIEKKRDGEEFTNDEIRYIVDSIADESMPRYQIAALCMAIYFQGMSAQEIGTLSEELMFSGENIILSDIVSPKIERYVTGGVGDKSPLVLGPLGAACGIVVPTLGGKDEDFIFGSLDKLSAIPGFRRKLTTKEFIQQLKQVKCAYIDQNEDIAPVDRVLYNIRQSTATIASLPLLTASILSKKMASGAEGLVIDVKWGNGSFIRDLEQARQLGRSITRVTRALNRRCVALVTNMNQPLGDCVGTGLEIQEAIKLLQGKGPEDLSELVLKLGMEFVRLSGISGSTLSAKQTILKHLSDGSALKAFKQMVEAQGGDGSYIDDPEKFSKAKYVKKLGAPARGYIHSVNSGMIARGVHFLAYDEKTQKMDPAAGVTNIKKMGMQVKLGEPMMMIHYNDETHLSAALDYLKGAFRLAPKRPAVDELVMDRIA